MSKSYRIVLAAYAISTMIMPFASLLSPPIAEILRADYDWLIGLDMVIMLMMSFSVLYWLLAAESVDLLQVGLLGIVSLVVASFIEMARASAHGVPINSLALLIRTVCQVSVVWAALHALWPNFSLRPKTT